MVIVIGFDKSPYGFDALKLGTIVGTLRGEPVHVVTVFPDDERGLAVASHDSMWINEQTADAELKLKAARSSLSTTDTVEFHTLGPGSASRMLHEYCEQVSATLLVVGASAHAAVGRVSFGSTVERLLPGAPCAIAVAPRGYRRYTGAISLVGVAYDGSPESDEALAFAIKSARRASVPIRAVIVDSRSAPESHAGLEQRLRSMAKDVEVTLDQLGDRDVAKALSDLPGERPDVLICGSRGYGRFKQVLLGSVSTQIVRNATYPVIITPRGASKVD